MIFSTLKNKAKDFLAQYEQKDPITFAAAQQAIGGLLILDGFVGIDNPFEGKKRPGIFGTLVGVVIGIVFMFVPGFFGNITGANNMTATTNATVVSMTPLESTSSRSGNPCSLNVQYTVAGKVYTQPSSMSSSDNCTLTAGQTIAISYNPHNPGAWAYNLKSSSMSLGLFFWGGLLVTITSFVTFIIRLLSIIFGWKLLQSGRALAKTLPQGVSLGTLIQEIKQNFTGSIFGRGGVGVATVAGLPIMQSVQTPVVASTPGVQATPGPVTAVPTPQFMTANSDPSGRPMQAPVQTGSIPVSPIEPVPIKPVSFAAPDSRDVNSAATPPIQPPSFPR